MVKPTWQIYINNTIAYMILLLLKYFFKPQNNKKNILFINTGQIGDLVISSVIFRNAGLLKQKYQEVFVLVKENYSFILECFNDINIIKWDYKKYKYNLFYRIKFILTLRKYGFIECFNLTAARGITVDELSLLSGAKNIYALNSNYKYLKKLFGTKTDKMYSVILAKEIENEFEKNKEVVKYINITNYKTETFLTIRPNILLKAELFLKPFDNKIKIVISPFSDVKIKNWGSDNYYNLILNILEKYKNAVIILNGRKEKKIALDKYTSIDCSRVFNTAGEFSIIESAGIVYYSDLFIGNDSGFTHIAKALQKPLIGIIGGGFNGIFLPYSPKDNEKYLYHKMDCFKCEWRCIHKEPYCLTEISVKEVIKNVNDLLSENF